MSKKVKESPKSLGEILEQIQKLRAIAGLNPADYPDRTRQAWAGRVRQAKDELVGLEPQYIAALQANSITIVPHGDADAVGAFAASARAEEVDLIADAGEFVNSIAAGVEKMIGKSRMWTVTCMEYTLRQVQNACSELGITRVSWDIGFKEQALNTPEAVHKMVSSVVDASAGPVARRGFVARELYNQAVKKGTKGRTISVLILGATSEAEASALQVAWPSTSRALRLDGTTGTTREDVLKTYERLRKTRKDAKASVEV
jgi:hypothetical protein